MREYRARRGGDAVRSVDHRRRPRVVPPLRERVELPAEAVGVTLKNDMADDRAVEMIQEQALVDTWGGYRARYAAFPPPPLSWVISVPVWGRDYVRTFAEAAAPALLAAARRLYSGPVRFVIHTDSPGALVGVLPGCDVEYRAVGAKPTYVALQESHADVMRIAAVGECVVLLNADLVISGNFLERAAEHVAAGKQAVVLLGVRTTDNPRARPPAGAAPRDLLAWAWEHRHQIIRDCEWPHGRTMLPTNLFWERGGSVVARAFHMHPVVVHKRAEINFHSTVDGDLLDHIPRDKIHVVADPDDCAMCEVSPPARRFPVGRHLTPEAVALSMRPRASAMHCWLFGHRIMMVGDGANVDDGPTARDILAALAAPPPPAARRR